MYICTLLTCATELVALPNNKTNPNVANKILGFIFVVLLGEDDDDLNPIHLLHSFLLCSLSNSAAA